jgi:hypothetical protein
MYTKASRRTHNYFVVLLFPLAFTSLSHSDSIIQSSIMATDTKDTNDSSSSDIWGRGDGLQVIATWCPVKGWHV